MDNATQHLTTTDLPIPTDDGHGDRRLLPDPLVGPRRVEVRHIFAQDTTQLGLVDDQQFPQTFVPYRPNPALGHDIGVRRSKRRMND
jgi:hypothetical protein